MIISAGCILMLVHSHVHDCYIIEANRYYLANINIKVNKYYWYQYFQFCMRELILACNPLLVQ